MSRKLHSGERDPSQKGQGGERRRKQIFFDLQVSPVTRVPQVADLTGFNQFLLLFWELILRVEPLPCI